jgi:hypothetical protein
VPNIGAEAMQCKVGAELNHKHIFSYAEASISAGFTHVEAVIT